MSRYVKRFLQVATTLATTLALLAVTSLVTVPKTNDPSSGMEDGRALGVSGVARDSLDVLFFGDSEAYSAISPLQMWGERGFASYVCASSGQQPNQSLSQLRRALETQRPKLAVFETDSFYFKPLTVKDVLIRAAQDVFPVLRYHDRWKRLTASDFLSLPSVTWTDPNRGFVPDEKVSEATVPEDFMAQGSQVEEMSAITKRYVCDMVACCRQNGVTPVFLSTPSTTNWSTARHNGVAQLAGELGVDYYDLNSPEHSSRVGIDWSTDTRDGGDHLNTAGSKKASGVIGEILGAGYGLTDHRGDASYASWDQDLSKLQSQIGS